MIPRVSLVVLACWVLGAHFLRQGLIVPAIVCVAMPLLLLVRKPWSRLVLQSFLYAGAVVWAYTAAALAEDRLAEGIPWIRGTAILVAVSVMSIAAGWLLNAKVIKSRF